MTMGFQVVAVTLLFGVVVRSADSLPKSLWFKYQKCANILLFQRFEEMCPVQILVAK